MNKPRSYEEMTAELDDLAAVPTDVLASWVTDQGRCLWETTFGAPPEWTGEDERRRCRQSLPARRWSSAGRGGVIHR